MGFEVQYQVPEIEPFFAIVKRGMAQIFLKEIGETVEAVPNETLHKWAPWDAFVYVETPSELQQDMVSRGTKLYKELHKRDDGLIGFEVRDMDGYVLFFGHPLSANTS